MKICPGKTFKKAEISPSKIKGSLIDSDLFIYSLLGITILFVLIARIHLLPFPLERDEGEYAYMGKLILDGHPPYTLAYNMKLPGTAYMYAVFMLIFGKSVVGIHLGFTCISIISIFLIYLVALNIVSKIGAFIASASFGLMATASHMFGQAAHATHFVIFFSLLAIYFLFRIYSSRKNILLKYLLSGFFFSLSFICKQPGLFFVFFGLSVIIVKEVRVKPVGSLVRHLLLFISGFVLPVLILILYLLVFGDFEKFWFWTVKYLSEYTTQVPASIAFQRFKEGLDSVTAGYSLVGYTALWITSLAGIPFVFISKEPVQKKILLLSFLFFSFLTIVPGLYFRCHYFITLLPAAGILIAVLFDYLNSILLHKSGSANYKFLTLIIFFILACSGVIADKNFLLKTDPLTGCKHLYRSNPFAESVAIGEFLKNNSEKNDKIAIMGSEPQIYFYADRYAATGYIYTYNLMEIHPYALAMQKEMAAEIEKSKPKYLLYVNMKLSWLVQPESEKYIFSWMDKYVVENYRLAGFIDMIPDKISPLKTGSQLINLNPQSNQFISIYVRK
jgi:hypothetical protein